MTGDLVDLSERFYHAVFVGTLVFVGIATAAALAFLPVRTSVDGHVPQRPAVAAGIIVLLLAGSAIVRARRVYVALLLWPGLQLVPVAVAAALVSVVSPIREELWWPACAILMLLGPLVRLRRALAYCLVVLLANLTAHLAAGDLHRTATVEILGLWIGLPFWTTVAVVIPNEMAVHLLGLGSVDPASARAPLKVAAWTSPPVDEPVTVTPSDETHTPTDTEPIRPALADTLTASGGLTARQLQVVSLLADGHRYRTIAACLSISSGQVHRHVANSISRLGVQSVSELVTVAVVTGMVATGIDPSIAVELSTHT